jgi:hypothetical protein
MEKARKERVNNQARDKDPAAKTARRSNRKAREEDAAVAVPVREKAGVAVAEKDRAVAREAVAVKIVETRPKEDDLMPGLDRNGPRGAGPMTGGRRGFCGCTRGATDMAVYGGGYGYGRGMGFRRGFGRGRGYGFGPAGVGYPYPQAQGTGHPVSKTDAIEMLRVDADAMRKSLESVQRKIAQLEKDGAE